MPDYSLPLLFQTDAVVIGGSLGGMACALTLGAQGKKVLLIEQGTCLYANLHRSGEYELPILSNKAWAELLFSPETIAENGMLHPARLKRYGEALMKAQGIELLYAVSVIDAQYDETGRIRLVLAHKSGLYAILCGAYYDCTQLPSEKPSESARYALHVVHGPEMLPEDVCLPSDIKTNGVLVPAGSMLSLSRGSAGDDHCVLHFPVLWDHADQETPEGQQALHQAALLLLSAYRELTHMPQLAPARSGLFCSPQSGIPAEQAINEGVEKAHSPDHPSSRSALKAPLSFANPLWNTSCSAPASLPDAQSTWQGDVIVVGGGTSGAVAALYAARIGMRTMVLEMNGMLGGTATAGGVSTYWFGLRGGATREIDQRVDYYYKQLSLERSACLWSGDDRFLPDIKALALLDLCLNAGCCIRFYSVACAVMMDEKAVHGVAYAMGGKLHLAYAKTVIDCTGDGDLAMFAGAAHTYGSRDNAITYWASLAQYTGPDKYRNNFSTMVHVGDPVDYTRFIQAGRLRGGDLLDHGDYVALRESRHIQGMTEVTLRDQLLMYRPEDTLYYCFSNYDPKGKLSADIVYAGLLPPNLLICIPRGAVIPVKVNGLPIRGLLVGGKAISCTHNALPAIRMQPDLQQQGLALAALASASIRQSVPSWKAEGVEGLILEAGGEFPRLPDTACGDLQSMVDALNGSETLEWLDASPASYLMHTEPVITSFLAEDCDIVPILNKAFDLEPQGTLKKLLLARLMLWHGSEVGVTVILDAIHVLLAGEVGLPRRTGPVTFGQLLPDHGLMPEAVYLLNSLAFAKETDITPVFEAMLHRLQAYPRDWRDLRQGVYCYIESFAYVSLRRNDTRFLPMLRALYALPEFSKTKEIELQDDLMSERLDMLRLALLHAIAALGDEDGFAGLKAFTFDLRRPIAISAQMVLSSLIDSGNAVKACQW